MEPISDSEATMQRVCKDSTRTLQGLAANGGGAPFPCPPPTFGCQTLVQAFARAPCSPLWGGGGGPASAGGGSSDRRSAVSGLGGSGPPPPRSLPPPSPVLEVVRAPPPRRTVGGVGVALRVGGPGPAGGGASRGTVPSPLPRAHRLVRRGAAVTCVVACVGAGAAAAAGSAGGSASGLGRCARPGGASCWHPHP